MKALHSGRIFSGTAKPSRKKPGLAGLRAVSGAPASSPRFAGLRWLAPQPRFAPQPLQSLARKPCGYRRAARRWKWAAALAFLLPVLAGCGAPPPPPHPEYVLGTRCQVNLYRDGKPEIYREIFNRLREIENSMSLNLSGSEISAINRAAGREAVRVSPALLEVLDAALFFAEKSGGAFDPSIGPLVKLWDISGEARIPPEEEIAAALDLVNWRDVLVDRDAGTVFLRREGMALDFGGIAKGYAADEAVKILRARRVRRAIVDLGGNIYVHGKKPGGGAWRVGIQNPQEARGASAGILELEADLSVVTSGVYERFFERDGQRYHHILSSRDGFPVRSGLLSVTIIAPISIDADALSTAVFALGWDDGAALLAELAEEQKRAGSEAPGPQAVFIFEDGSIRLTPGAKGLFLLNNDAFRLWEE